ncbi:MAG: hypothetical protein ABI834_04890, partial [Ginsengibacter sp.]
MKKFILNSTLGIIVMLACNNQASAQSNKPYTEGPLWQVQFINTKAGMGDLYLKNLSEGWIKQMRAAKEAGLIMDFKVLEAPNATENDWNLILMYELKNYAMLDGMVEKMDALSSKIFGSKEIQHTNAVSRNDLRVMQGGRLT